MRPQWVYVLKEAFWVFLLVAIPYAIVVALGVWAFAK